MEKIKAFCEDLYDIGQNLVPITFIALIVTVMAGIIVLMIKEAM